MKLSSQRNRHFKNPKHAVQRMHEIAYSEQTTAYVVRVLYGILHQHTEFAVRIAAELVCAPVAADWLQAEPIHECVAPVPAFLVDTCTYKLKPESKTGEIIQITTPEPEILAEPVPVAEPIQRNIEKTGRTASYFDFHILNTGIEFINGEGTRLSKLHIFEHFNHICETQFELADILETVSSGTYPGLIAVDKKGWKDGKLIKKQ